MRSTVFSVGNKPKVAERSIKKSTTHEGYLSDNMKADTISA